MHHTRTKGWVTEWSKSRRIARREDVLRRVVPLAVQDSSGSSSSGSRSSSSSSSSRSRSRSPRRRENGRVRGGRSRSPIRRGGSPPRGARADRDGGRPSPSPPRRRRVTPSPPRRDRRDRSRSGPRRRSSPRRASPAPARSASPIKRVVIKNLSRNVLRAHLEEIFSIYGAITKVDLPVDRNHQHLHRGIGYIDYESVEDAEKSIKYMDGGQVDGQVIQVEMTIGGRAFVSGQRRVSPFRRRASPPPRDRKSPIRRGGGGRSPPTFRRRSPMAGGRRSPMGGRGSGANNAPLGPSRFRRGGSRSRSPVGRRSRS
ncbi:hypothetical protein GCK72_011855 [Caenorhabditis remanei]|uniref:RRM domain-containing protein n=1 Tax=Caenorhabditis remanei TaxID=31234 RepID=A0A6A5H779_CAERE|nr:hypothetical protein GCK72_011855 [Caenorhabditis remanei]KAF1763588.1 hypothetical protein GCK72_011855 [Caenorhabditis remanei]